MPNPGASHSRDRHAQQSTPQSFRTQIIPRDDISHVRSWIETNETNRIEDYLVKCRDLGWSILHQVTQSKGDTTMVCMIEEIHKTTAMNPSKNYQNYRVVGFPVVHSNIYNNQKVQFKISTNDSVNPTRRLGVTSLDSIEVKSDADSQSVVIDLKTVSSLDQISFNSALDEHSYGEVVLNNENTNNKEWSSLQIIRKQDDAAVVNTILDLIPEDEISGFIQQADKLGMTALHWSAYNDNSTVLEEAMDRMCLEDQEEALLKTDNKGWTMMHMTAYRDAGSVMKELQNKFGAERNITWKILTCKTEDGKTPLHVAVAEKNVKAVIALLDFADDHRHLYLEQQDSGGRTVQDYTSEESLLGNYLRLATGIRQDSVLHGAARTNDVKAVELVLDNLGNTESAPEICLRENKDGVSLLQAAAAHNSTHVLESLARRLSEEELLEYLPLLGSNGQTALHMAAMSSKPSAISTLLRFIHHKNWSSLLNTPNKSGKSVKDVAPEGVQEIIKYHELLSSGGPDVFFQEMEYSLFHIKGGEEFIETRYRVLENRHETQLGYVQNMNYDTAICILKGDLVLAEHRITQLLQSGEYHDHVHTVSNQGFLKMKRNDEPEEVWALAKKVIGLLTDDKSRIIAKIDYAYWIAEAERTEDARNRSCSVFEACLLETLNCPESDGLRALGSYFYSKILIRMMREKDLRRSNRWYEDKILTVIHLFLLLVNADHNLYLGVLWLWIAELQCKFIKKKAGEQLRRGLALLNENEPQVFVDTQPATCLHKASWLRNNYEHDPKFIMRIARNCLELADQVDDREQRGFWLRQALKYSEECEGSNDNTFMMCLITSIRARISLWAMDYFFGSKYKVHRCFKARTGKVLRETDYNEACRFVEEEYYCISLRDDLITCQYLKKARDNLVKLVTEHKDGWKFRGATLGRVKYILGDPIEEVLECFQTAVNKMEKPKDELLTYQQYGLFYEILGQNHPKYPRALEDADRYHTMAIEVYNHNKRNAGWPSIAFHSKRCLREKQLYRQTSGW